MYKDVEEKIAASKGETWSQKWITGLPIGFKLGNGVVIGGEA
jgi:salicylate hydroxylase